ncbi:PREDICTED: E3 ubiquitin-protein ligase BOI-like [Tarenaya hassleriana]|uniref:E3 ubiquitin-protein ligase BOI-like n=1 Tax=Tarenaya hassleriana TaxID=28532 RepID=UPI00053C4773|nr:PREDICTED: E3 ubiquitin-protein ligase BOI-like [Tarenaya hassleriana]
MAVEAPHISIFPPQLMSNVDCVKSQASMNHTQMQIDFSRVPLATVDARKRSRNSAVRDSDDFLAAEAEWRATGFGPLVDQELVSQIQQQQSEIDRFVAQRAEKLRMELEKRHRTQTRMLAFTIQTAIAKKLEEKDDEIVRLRKLNWVLQERVKSLFVENQNLRDLAEANEAMANNLRANLEQVLAQVDGAAAALEDEVESSCGSCGGGVAGGDVMMSIPGVRGGGCRRCGEREAMVLVLPCRHLCLCTVCGSAPLRACPVCDTVMNASVRVNMS